MEECTSETQRWKLRKLGPVVQSVVSLTSSLRVISLTVLADSIYNIMIFFAEKMWVAFAMQKLLTFFQQKISAYLRIDVNFNESLTNDVVSFEQLGPVYLDTPLNYISEGPYCTNRKPADIHVWLMAMYRKKEISRQWFTFKFSSYSVFYIWWDRDQTKLRNWFLNFNHSENDENIPDF